MISLLSAATNNITSLLTGCLMESRVKEIIARVLNVDLSVVTDELSSGDIPQWDSVGNLAIISTIEQELEVEFPLEDLFDLTSVKSIVDEVNQLTDA